MQSEINALRRAIARNTTPLDSFDSDAAAAALACDTARQLMTSDIVTLTPGEPLERAAELFAAKQVHRAPVIGNGAVVGMLTSFDVVRALAEKSS